MKILRLLRILGKNDADASEAMNDILAQVEHFIYFYILCKQLMSIEMVSKVLMVLRVSLFKIVKISRMPSTLIFFTSP